MLLQRRAAMATASCTATLAAIGITPIAVPSARAPHNEFDRELRLMIGDGFTRQTWVQAGRQWSETRDTLAMHADEIVRIRVFNDTASVRVISFGEARPMLRVRPGQYETIDLVVDSLAPFEISVVGQPPMSRPVRVREAGAGA